MIRCPSERQLESLLEETLAPADLRWVSSHVGGCERCQAVLERLTADEQVEDSVVLSSVRASVSSHADLNAPVEFLNRLRRSPPGSLPAAPDRPAAGDKTGSIPIPSESPQIPGYEIIREVGRGGMGVVYQARHLSLNRLVALKMIRGLAGPRELSRFRQEAEAVARLHHPNIVQIYDIGESAGRPFLALEYVAGGSLVHQLRGIPQPVYPAARLVETLARAVHFAHERGVVHRDLKPANILLAVASAQWPVASNDSALLATDHWPLATVPKIADFGLAKRIDSPANSMETSEMVGTPSYMAPEQAAGRGQPVGPGADIYALGAILYEMLTGRPPFKGPTALDTVLQVLHEEPVRPGGLRPKLPRDLETICLKCLEKEPHKRYATALALAEDLRRFRHGAPIHARPVSLRERAWKWARRRPVHAALLLGIVLVTVAGFAGITWQWQEAATARDVALAEKREKEIQKEQADTARAVAEDAQQHAAEQRRQARVALYYNRIAQSELQWRVNDFPSAEKTLADCLPAAGLVDRRGWEWYYLRGLYRTELFTLHHQVEGIDCGVDIRADGRWIVSVQGGHPPEDSGKSAEVRIWDARTGAILHTWDVPAAFHRVAFSPDGSRVALAGTNGVVVIRTIETREIQRCQSHRETVAAIAFSPDGRYLASAGWDGAVQVWDVREMKAVRTLKAHTGRVYHLAFHPDGRRLASAGEDATVRVWNYLSGEEVAVYKGHKSPVYSVAYNPDGDLLVSAGSNGNIKIWESATGRVTQSVTGQAGAVLSVAFSPDSRYLAYGGGDTTVRVWDVEEGVERFTFRGHLAPVDGVRFTPDGQRLVSSSAGQAAVKVWDLTRHPEFATLARTVADIEALAFRDEGTKLASVTVAGKLQVWDPASGVIEVERTLPVCDKPLSPAVLASFSEDGKRLATRGRTDGKTVLVWDVGNGALVTELRGHSTPVTVVRLSADGRHIATACCESVPANPSQPVSHHVTIWEAATGRELASFEGKGRLANLLFSANGRHLAMGGEAGSLVVREWAENRIVFQTAAHAGDVAALVFSPDGQRLVAAGLEDRSVKVWELNGASPDPPSKPVMTLVSPRYVCDLAFSPDGRRLAGITRDLVKLWDTETGQEVLTLRGAPQRHFEPAFNPRVLFSPDGKRLAGTNWDESISVWDAGAVGSEAALARRQAARRTAADQRAVFWHLQEAEHCLEHKNPGAARFHLQQLARADVPEPLRLRRDRAAAIAEKMQPVKPNPVPGNPPGSDSNPR